MQNDYYLVEKIIAKKKSGKSVKYLVKWVGFPLDQSTWEPIEHLENVKLLVEEFENSQKENLNLDYNPNKKKYRKTNEDLTDSDCSVSDDESDVEERSDHSNSSREFPQRNINKISARKKSTSQLISKKDYRTINLNREQNDIDKDDDREDAQMNVDYEVDEPLRVIDSKMDNKKKVTCLIEWKVRSDGMKPDDSYISTDILKEKYPKFLIDYYESRIKFVK